MPGQPAFSPQPTPVRPHPAVVFGTPCPPGASTGLPRQGTLKMAVGGGSPIRLRERRFDRLKSGREPAFRRPLRNPHDAAMVGAKSVREHNPCGIHTNILSPDER